MWAGVVLVLLAGVPPCPGDEYSAYQYYESDRDDEDGDFYDIYVEDPDTQPTLMTEPMDSFTRIRRYGEREDIRTLAPKELQFVKGALKDMLYAHDLDRLTRPVHTSSTPQSCTVSTSSASRARKVKRGRLPTMDFSKFKEEDLNAEEKHVYHSLSDGGFFTTRFYGPQHGGDRISAMEEDARKSQAIIDAIKSSQAEWKRISDQILKDSTNATLPPLPDLNTTGWFGNLSALLTTTLPSSATNSTTTTTTTPTPTTTEYYDTETTGSTSKPTRTRFHSNYTYFDDGKSPRMDINAIIAIIANLTYDYDWNLTEQFNKTLIEHGVPTCPTESTATTTSTTPSPYDFSNSSVVGKCFVCGLKDLEIPRGAHCADAFAGDFLPLVPVDPRARGQIATFRKYCRYLDVNNYVENPSEARSIYGRFTGGCGVRWTDLTGVYTQRTCRSRFRPLMGRHFASKRMAKLELALINVENGCIISPMASLLPLSRGISLYARFHACVCTGSWCNRARLPPVARAAAALACALPRLLA